MKYSSRFGTADVWNVDHFMALSGLADPSFNRALVAALVGIMNTFKPDAVVDSWNPWACIAARYLRKPLITVLQADSHPQSRGFIWWKDPPSDLPTPVPAVNDVLTEYGLPAIKGSGDLFVGDLTLVVGIPELAPLPDTAGVTYVGDFGDRRHNLEIPQDQFPPVLEQFRGYGACPRNSSKLLAQQALRVCVSRVGAIRNPRVC